MHKQQKILTDSFNSFRCGAVKAQRCLSSILGMVVVVVVGMMSSILACPSVFTRSKSKLQHVAKLACHSTHSHMKNFKMPSQKVRNVPITNKMIGIRRQKQKRDCYATGRRDFNRESKRDSGAYVRGGGALVARRKSDILFDVAEKLFNNFTCEKVMVMGDGWMMSSPRRTRCNNWREEHERIDHCYQYIQNILYSEVTIYSSASLAENCRCARRESGLADRSAWWAAARLGFVRLLQLDLTCPFFHHLHSHAACILLWLFDFLYSIASAHDGHRRRRWSFPLALHPTTVVIHSNTNYLPTKQTSNRQSKVQSRISLYQVIRTNKQTSYHDDVNATKFINTIPSDHLLVSAAHECKWIFHLYEWRYCIC